MTQQNDGGERFRLLTFGAGAVVACVLIAAGCTTSGSRTAIESTVAASSASTPVDTTGVADSSAPDTGVDDGVCGGLLEDPTLANYCGTIGTPDNLSRDDVTVTWGSADSYSQGKRQIANNSGQTFFVLVVHSPSDAYLLAKLLADGTLIVVDVLDLHEDNQVVDGDRLLLMDEINGPAVGEYRVVGEHFVSAIG